MNSSSYETEAWIDAIEAALARTDTRVMKEHSRLWEFQVKRKDLHVVGEVALRGPWVLIEAHGRTERQLEASFSHVEAQQLLRLNSQLPGGYHFFCPTDDINVNI